METIDALARRIRMTLGQEQCDLAIRHVDVVDVLNCEIIRNATVSIADGVILSVLQDDMPLGPARAGNVVDGKGKVLIPGLMDAHIHIESTLLTPERFAAAVLPLGTTRVVADPHEIANVAGVDGLQYMLDASEGLPLHMHFALPSCVPCTPFEDAGAELLAKDLRPFLKHPRVCSLGEVMNYPGVLACDGGLLSKIDLATAARLTVDGHCPLAHGRQLAAYVGSGVSNDHECSTPDGMRRKIAAGLYIFIRHGSAASSLERLLPGITPANARRCCLCTDDMHAGDILKYGHINHTLARAVELGLDAPLAVAMATFNPARAYGMSRIGAIAPGFCADMCLVDDLKKFNVDTVWCAGHKVAEHGRLLVELPARPVPESIHSSVHLADFSEESLRIPLPTGRARVIVLQPHSLVTQEQIMDVATTQEGNFAAKLNPGLCKIAVLERHKASGHIGLGILSGYVRKGALLDGAIATSIAHDSHNIVVAGSDDADMVAAVRAICAMQGGIAIVRKRHVLVRLALPVGGIMSQDDASQVARLNTAINATARELAINETVDPVVTLAFMSLCVIPALKVNTRGLFSVQDWRFVDIACS
ncbi:MAG: adenine deaminase [Desulfovibrio sp.]|nr:adenine deaminase [Desulfovibrio sp.]